MSDQPPADQRTTLDSVIQEQIAYYRARAAEYDEWFYRLGRYDHGDEANRAWFAEVVTVQRAFHLLDPVDRALELACGTGIWTQELVKGAGSIVAIDASAEALALNRVRLGSDKIDYREANLFDWEPDTTYDLVVCCFFLSHVPDTLLVGFLDKLARAVRPGGKLFMVDSLNEQTATASDQAMASTGEIVTRRVNSGETFQIVKVYYDASKLGVQLSAHGFDAIVKTSGKYFWYTTATRHG